MILRVGLVGAQDAHYPLRGLVERAVDVDPYPGADGGAQGPGLVGVGDLDGEVEGVREHLAPQLAPRPAAREPDPREIGDRPQGVHVLLVVEDRALEERAQDVSPLVPASKADEARGRRVAEGRAVQERVVEDPRLLSEDLLYLLVDEGEGRRPALLRLLHLQGAQVLDEPLQVRRRRRRDAEIYPEPRDHEVAAEAGLVQNDLVRHHPVDGPGAGYHGELAWLRAADPDGAGVYVVGPRDDRRAGG